MMEAMDLKKTTLFFGLPGICIFFMFTWWGYEELIRLGLPIYWSSFICLWGPVLAMAVFVFIRFSMSGLSFTEYFTIGKLTKKQILIMLGAFLAVQFLEASLGFTRPMLASLPGFHVPGYYPDLFGLNVEFKIPLEYFLGMRLNGNIFPVFFWLLWLATNIGGEELLWRGYALPRMVKHFGKWAWLVNGLLWNICIHFFMRWSFVTLLPVTLIVPYLSQRYQSIWPGVIIHGLGNLLVFALLIPSVMS